MTGDILQFASTASGGMIGLLIIAILVIAYRFRLLTNKRDGRTRTTSSRRS